MIVAETNGIVSRVHIYVSRIVDGKNAIMVTHLADAGE